MCIMLLFMLMGINSRRQLSNVLEYLNTGWHEGAGGGIKGQPWGDTLVLTC